MISDDTIVAISSATGPAARMIVRLSGVAAVEIVSNWVAIPPPKFPSGAAVRVHLNLNDLSFPATCYCFRGPKSATGEDVIEIHLPGNPLLARMVLDAAIRAGARSAEPGEFTARAYFNGRLDLSSAEGVSAVISAQNQRELDAARRLLGGELSRRLRPTIELLAESLALIEAAIDFAGEEITVLDRSQIEVRISRIDSDLKKLLAESSRFEALSHEPRIVLVGRPNAGKSTLLNALAGMDRAIVSPVAGTTRDVVSARVKLARGMVLVMDAAGLEEANVRDEVSEQMRAASLRALGAADVVVLVREVGDERPEIALPVEPHLRVGSKADRGESSDALVVSAHTGVGMSELQKRLDALAFGAPAGDPTLALNARHLRCIDAARAALVRAGDAVELELIAFELRESLDSLGEVLGSVTPDDVLGRVFSRFCIGK